MITRMVWSSPSVATLAMCQSRGKKMKNSPGLLSKKRAL